MFIAIRDESPLVCGAPGAPDVSEHTCSHFGTCHIGSSTIRDCTTALFQVTMYMQFARKVGTSANSALIRYYLRRLKLNETTSLICLTRHVYTSCVLPAMMYGAWTLTKQPHNNPAAAHAKMVCSTSHTRTART